MSEVELVLVNDTDKCTIYTIQFSEESETEYERFFSKFIEDAHLNQDLLRKIFSARGQNARFCCCIAIASFKASVILFKAIRQNSDSW